MKSIYLLTVFIYIFISETTAQYFNGYTYNNNGGSIYKADSVGNIIWSKSFGSISPSSSGPTWVHETVSDGRFVYTLLLDGNIYWPTPGASYYQAIIVLDTGGTYISTKYHQFNPANSYNVFSIHPSVVSGAFFADDYSPGFSHQLTIYKVNNTGAITNGYFFASGQVVDLSSFISLHDSTYLAGIFSADGSGGIGSRFIKLDESGSPIWNKTYYTTTPGYEFLSIQSMTQDSSGYIYLLCGYQTASLEGICGIKIDLNGTPILGNIYEGFPWPHRKDHQLSYRNNQLIDLYNDSIEIVFDTLFMNSCLNPLPMNLVSYNSLQPTQNIISSSSHQTQIFDNPITLNPSTTNLINYCTTLNMEEQISNPIDLYIFPNPTSDYFSLVLSETIGNKIENVEIKDAIGKKVLETGIKGNQNIDVSTLKKGIYILSVVTTRSKIVKRIIIN